MSIRNISKISAFLLILIGSVDAKAVCTGDQLQSKRNSLIFVFHLGCNVVHNLPDNLSVEIKKDNYSVHLSKESFPKLPLTTNTDGSYSYIYNDLEFINNADKYELKVDSKKVSDLTRADMLSKEVSGLKGGGASDTAVCISTTGYSSNKIFTNTYQNTNLISYAPSTQTKTKCVKIDFTLHLPSLISEEQKSGVITSSKNTIQWTKKVDTWYKLERKVGNTSWNTLFDYTKDHSSYVENYTASNIYSYRLSACKAGLCETSEELVWNVDLTPPAPQLTLPSTAVATPTSFIHVSDFGFSSTMVNPRYEVLVKKLENGVWSDWQAFATVKDSTDSSVKSYELPVSNIKQGSQYLFKARACSSSCSSYTEAANALEADYLNISTLTSPAVSTDGHYDVSWNAVTAVGSEGARYYLKETMHRIEKYHSNETITNYVPIGIDPTIFIPIYSYLNNDSETNLDPEEGTVSIYASQVASTGTSQGWGWSSNVDGTIPVAVEGIITMPFHQEYDGTYSYEVKTCYLIDGVEDCTEYSSAVTTEVTIAMATPTLTLASESTSFDISMSWSNLPGDDVYYEVFSEHNQLLHTSQVGETSWSDYSITSNGSYSFKVRACSNAGCSDMSSIKTINVDIAPDTPFLSLIETGLDFSLQWNTQERATSYLLEHKYGSSAWNQVAILTSDDELKYDVSIPSEEMLEGDHYYRVKACEGSYGYCSNYSARITKNVNTQPVIGNIYAPSAQQNFAYGFINLTWDADTRGLADAYEIYQKDDTGDIFNEFPTFKKIATTDQLHLSITVSESGTYEFIYKACKNYNSRENVCSDSFSENSVVAVVNIPQAVTEGAVVTAPANADSGYSVSWLTVPHADIYELYQSLDGGANFTKVKTVNSGEGNSFTYNPEPMTWGRHQYYVTAFNTQYAAYADALNLPNVAGPVVGDTVEVNAELDETVFLRKYLYFTEADNIDIADENPVFGQFSRDAAAFRYLDLMYTFNPVGPKVENNYMNGNAEVSFSDLYGDAEDARVDQVLLQLVENLDRAYESLSDSAEAKRFKNSKDLMLDVFYDRAVAKIVQGNLLMDEARISRLRNEETTVETGHLAEASAVYRDALDEYQELVIYANKYTGILNDNFVGRKQKSPRYWKEEGFADVVSHDQKSSLLQGYKDLVMYYQLMAKVINSKVAHSKRIIVDALNTQTDLSILQYELENLAIELNTYDSNMRSVIREIPIDETNELELSRALASYGEAKIHIGEALNWISGKSNVIGMADDSLAMISGYGVDGNTQFDSYNSIRDYLLTPSSVLNVAAADYSKAVTDYESYRHSQDELAEQYNDRNQQLNNQLVTLIGYDVTESDFNENSPAVRGSEVYLQKNRIEAAHLSVEASILQLENLLTEVEILVETQQAIYEIQDGMNSIILDYGNQQSTIQGKIGQVQTRLAKARKRSSLMGGMGGIVASALTCGPCAIGNVISVAGQMQAANAEIKAARSLGQLNALSVQVSTAERLALKDAEEQIMEHQFAARIKSILLQVDVLELDIEKATLASEQEVDRMEGMINQVARLREQIENTNSNLTMRYFADPIHGVKLTQSMVDAEVSFNMAQEWMFLAANGLEYKHQVSFDYAGYTTADIFKARNAEQLQRIFNLGIQAQDLSQQVVSTKQDTDTLSFKEDIFGYYARIDDRIAYYPHPDPAIGDDQMLTADEAFEESLKQNLVKRGGEDWVVLNFNTVKSPARGNLFKGPLMSTLKVGEGVCIKDGGTYLDKIESVAINIPNWYSSRERKTDAYLEYGGIGYMRKRYPAVTDGSAGAEAQEEFTMHVNRFWETIGDRTANFKTYYREPITANIDISSHADDKTYAFKERSVAATDWVLEFKIKDSIGTLLTLDSIGDIELIIDHRYVSRNYSETNCN